MKKKTLYMLIALPVLLILAACSSLQIPGVSAKAAPSQAAARQGGFNQDPAKMPVEQKLGIGILKLEGTPQAVTPQQAQQLLPLWKAVKSLRTSNTSTLEEITALYQQIQGVLTPEQVQAIQKMTWTQSELQATMQQYGINFAQFANGRPTLDPSARATRVAQFQAQGGGNGGGGGGGGFGGAGGFGGGGFGGAQGGANAQRTPVPGQNQARRGAGGGFNSLFADAVIKLLQQKAGA